MSQLMLKTGDYVVYRPGFGMDDPVLVTIEGMAATSYTREKYGRPKQEVPYELVRQNLVLFSFSNGHWAYSDQVDIHATQQANIYMHAPVADVVEKISVLHPLIVKARLNPKETL